MLQVNLYAPFRKRQGVKSKLMFRLMCLSLLLAIALPSTVLASENYPTLARPAQDGGNTLTYGTEVAGEITAEAFEQLWALEAASADRIGVRVERTGGNLVPMVSIIDAAGTEITSSYGPDETQAASQIDSYELPTAGTYQVRVYRQYEESGTTTGTYSLSVSLFATAEDNPNNVTPVGEVTYDAPVQGNVTPNRWRNVYTLQAAGADVVSIRADRTSGTLVPYIEVLDANGGVLSGGYGYSNDANDAASVQEVELPSPGQYSVVVTRNNGFDGLTVGGFNLTVSLLGSGEDNPVLSGNAPGTIAYDTPATGELGNAIWYQDWILTPTSTDRVSIKMTRTSGNLIPRFVILGGSGQELYTAYEDYSYAQATIEDYGFDVAGTFTVRVFRADEKFGATTGGYELVVALEGAGEDSETMQGFTGTISKGTPVTGTVTNARWADAWTYEGVSGEVIDITVERTGGTLVPLLEVRDANGQTITSAYVEDTGDRAEITRFTVPTNGQYRIVVVRNSEQHGHTTGEYSLTITDTVVQ